MILPMQTSVWLMALLLLVQAGQAEVMPQAVRRAADGITAAQLERDLAFLSSDDLRGRATPSPGFDKAADYIISRLKAAGVTPAGDTGTYVQTYEMHEARVDAGTATVTINDVALRLDEGFVLRSFSGEPLSGTWPVVYVGHGWVIPDKGIDPYAGVDVRGKVVLTHGPRAMPKDVTIQQFGRVTVGATNITTEAARRGAVAVVMIPQTSAQPGWWQQLQGQNLVRRELHPWVPSAYAAPQVTSALLSRAATDALMQGERFTAAEIVARGDSQDYPASFALSKRITFNIPSSTVVHRPYNVVAKIEGSDSALRNEHITVMAHLDGAVGTRTVDGDDIYNSADDNASGSAGMLSIVEQMMKTTRPKRSMIFVWDSGEEVGLWGTRHFVANPPVPLSSVVAHINIDMIGATRAPGTADEHSPDVPGPNEVYLIGPGVLSSRANALIERVNRDYLNMTLNRADDRWDSEFFYPRTDAGPFLERGILTIGWNTGLHRRYHLPSDEAKYLDPKKIEVVSRTVFATLWMLADDPERPRIENPIPVSVLRHAQPGGRVDSVAVVPREGYVTVTWRPVAGATEYQIEREGLVTGIWRPNRQVRQQSPSFADAGFVPGGTLRWRVRAVVGDVPQEWSEPVSAQTRAPFGPAEFRTGFEARDGAEYTTYDEEIDWTKRIVAASPRVRVVPLGTTPQGRTMNLFVIGHPAPKGTVAEIASGPAAGANCNVHGNEPSGREGCLMMIRELAFSNDPAIIDILSHATVLIVPSFNADGRANNTRGNSAGQDLNRDHARLTQPESQMFAAFVRDYTPEVMVDGHEYGSATTCDLPLLWPRHSNTATSVHDMSKAGLVEGRFYDAGATDGWWPCPYPPRGIDGAQTFTRVTGLKNMVTTLVEARSGGGPTRQAEAGNVPENRRRKAYSQLWSIRQALMFHRANRPAIAKAIEDGIAFQRSNTGPIVFHGDWDVPAFAAPHPGDTPPPGATPGPDQMLTPPPCGYFLTDAQYSAKLTDSGTLPEALWTSVGDRLAAHGITVEKRPGGYLVPLAQPLRGLINILLDAQTPPAPIVAAERRMRCSVGNVPNRQ